MQACMWHVGPTVLVVAEDVPEDQRLAALDALSHAQGYADSGGSRFGAFKRWHDDCKNALSSHGWLITNSHWDDGAVSADSVLRPAQPLLLWLGQRCPSATALLEAALEALAGEGLAGRLRDDVQRTQDGYVSAVHCMGLVLPGPQLECCALTLRTQQPRADLGDTLDGAQLHGEVMLRSFSALRNPAFEQPLPASEGARQRYTAIGEITPGGKHG